MRCNCDAHLSVGKIFYWVGNFGQWASLIYWVDKVINYRWTNAHPVYVYLLFTSLDMFVYLFLGNTVYLCLFTSVVTLRFLCMNERKVTICAVI